MARTSRRSRAAPPAGRLDQPQLLRVEDGADRLDTARSGGDHDHLLRTIEPGVRRRLPVDVDDRGAPRNSYRCTRPRTRAATRELPAIGCSAARTRPPPSFQATTSSASSPIRPARSPPAAASRNPVSSRTCSSRVVVPRRAPAEIRCRARAASCRQCTTAELAPSGRCGPG